MHEPTHVQKRSFFLSFSLFLLGGPSSRRLAPVIYTVRTGCPGFKSYLRHSALFLCVTSVERLDALPWYRLSCRLKVKHAHSHNAVEFLFHELYRSTNNFLLKRFSPWTPIFTEEAIRFQFHQKKRNNAETRIIVSFIYWLFEINLFACLFLYFFLYIQKVKQHSYFTVECQEVQTCRRRSESQRDRLRKELFFQKHVRQTVELLKWDESNKTTSNVICHRLVSGSSGNILVAKQESNKTNNIDKRKD